MRRLAAPLLGAAILTAFSVAALPFSRGLFRVPQTPYDGSGDPNPPAWILLARSDAIIPRGASVVIRVEPPDSVYDSYLHRFGVGLLPGRKIVPAALWGVPTPPNLIDAEYEIVVGERPPSPPGRLLLEIPQGTVWARGR